MSLSQSLTEPIAGSGIGADAATVTALSGALSSGALTAADLAAYYQARIERLNPELRAVITVSRTAAREAAASDSRRASGESQGQLDGIPVLIKDNIAAAGLPATAGSPALLGAASDDAFLVSALRRAGAVVIGKANLSEWANFRSRPSSSGWSTLGGQAVNPRGAGRSPSGSSSGSAIAVAAGLAPLAIGTETDGSIVSPAAACGVVGLKPTLGLVSRTGIVPISAAQDTAGPMTRTVADAAVVLSVIAGADGADPATAPAAAYTADYACFLDAGALVGARLGVWREGSAPAGRMTAAVLDGAIARLRALGADVIDPVRLADVGQLHEPELAALLHEFKHDINAYLHGLGGDHPVSLAELIDFNARNGATVLAQFGQELFDQAEATSGDLAEPGYAASRGDALRLARGALDGALAEHRLDAVVALTGSPAWLIDPVLGDHDLFSTSSPAAVSGYPALTVPAGQVSGLPVGLSLIGPPWSEPRLIALGYAFEQGSLAADRGGAAAG